MIRYIPIDLQALIRSLLEHKFAGELVSGLAQCEQETGVRYAAKNLHSRVVRFTTSVAIALNQKQDSFAAAQDESKVQVALSQSFLR